MPNDYWLSATDASKLDSHSRYDDLFLPGLELHLDRYNYRRSGCRFVEGRTLQIQGDPLPVLHEGLLQRKRKSARTAKNASASTQFQTDFHSVGLHFQTLIPLLLLLLQSHLGNVLVDMKLIDIKDTLPVGFIPIQETVDTRKSPEKHWVGL